MSSGCKQCQPCRECGADAWCEANPGQIQTPCPHHEPLCGDCVSACPDCAAAIEVDLDKALRDTFEKFDGDPFRREGNWPDPFAPQGDKWTTFNTPWREATRKDNNA